MRDRRTVKKWFWVWEFEKEEEWLNTMAQSGWALCGVGFCRYDFERCEPGEYTIRLELHEPDEDYLSFMDEIGAEYVGRMVRWIYFRKKSEEGSFELFSDIASRITHLEKISRMLAAVTLLNLGIGFMNSVNPTHVGWINLLAATLLTYCLGRIHGKKEALEREKLLHE